MKQEYEIKNLEGGVLDVDDASRRVKVAINKVGVKDGDGDVIEKSAFDKTIKEVGPKGKNLVWHLTDHNPSLKFAVGKFKELGIENDYLYGITDIPNTTWGNDMLEFYKSGTINQHSIGFRTIKEKSVKESGAEYNLIQEVKLYEGSAVLWGANEFTPTITVGKSLSIEERKSEFDKTTEEITNITKLFRTGHLSDDAFELLEMKLAQLAEKLQNLYKQATQPVVETVEPDVIADIFKSFTNNLKTAN